MRLKRFAQYQLVMARGEGVGWLELRHAASRPGALAPLVTMGATAPIPP